MGVHAEIDLSFQSECSFSRMGVPSGTVLNGPGVRSEPDLSPGIPPDEARFQFLFKSELRHRFVRTDSR